MNYKTRFGGLFSTNDAERAVSPVIGVILMVAVTVILAATAGAFLFGFGNANDEEVQAGVSVTGQNSDETTVTWTSEGSATSITFNPDTNVTGALELTSIGDSTTIDTSGSGSFSIIAESEETGGQTVIRTVSYDNS
jgi:flagellin-like protein